MLRLLLFQELKRIQSVPLIIGQFNEMVDSHYGVVNSTAGSTYYVRVLSTLDRELLKPNTSIALHRHSHSVVDILPPESDSSIQLMVRGNFSCLKNSIFFFVYFSVLNSVCCILIFLV